MKISHFDALLEVLRPPEDAKQNQNEVSGVSKKASNGHAAVSNPINLL